MFNYNIFDNIGIAMHKAKSYSRIKKELKKSDLTLEDKIQLCQERKEKLSASISSLEDSVMYAKEIRDDAVDAWIDEYGTGDEKNDFFDAMDECHEEDKAFEDALDRLLECEGAIKAYEKAINVMNKEMSKNATKAASRR